MRVLVTGANGQLGYDIVRRLKNVQMDCIATTRNNLDITNESQVKEVCKYYKPDVVVHCAAYTAVDRAEEKKRLCYNTNVLGSRYVAEACRDIKAKLVYISTDYVFNGEGKKPIEVTDKTNPINYYGKTKYEGELEVQQLLEKYFIVRISWVFGSYGDNFVKTMLKLGKERDEISVVSDQFGSPTYTYDLAGLVIEMIKSEKYGVYHATNEGYCTWYEFACEIFKQAGIHVKVNPISTEEYQTIAKRPKNSTLSSTKLKEKGFNELASWKSGVMRLLNELRKNNVSKE